MRPGHVCPGKPPRTSPASCATTRFNEAGACLPRKGPRIPGEAVCEEASMRPGHVCPGKPTAVCRPADNLCASMRPGHVCPGNRRPRLLSPRRARGFNEAGACLPRKRPARAGAPAARARFNEAGACLPRKGAGLAIGADRRPASMRPGHVCPGKMSRPRPRARQSGLQ